MACTKSRGSGSEFDEQEQQTRKKKRKKRRDNDDDDDDNIKNNNNKFNIIIITIITTTTIIVVVVIIIIIIEIRSAEKLIIVEHYLDASKEGKEGNVLVNDALNTFYLRLYGVIHMVKDHSDCE